MTAMSRRTVLRSGVAAVVVAPFLSTEQVLAATKTTNLMARSRFTPHLNSTFKMISATAIWSVTLAQIADLQPVLVVGDDNRYSLTFRASTAGPAQGAYTFRRAGFTDTTLFVVPSDVERRIYQAIVNRSF